MTTEEWDGQRYLVHLDVAETDMGKVIGRGGRVAEAMRALLKVSAARAGHARRPRHRRLTRLLPELDPTSAVSVGRIVAPHGVSGEVKVEPLTDFPQRFEPNSRLYLGDSVLVVEASRWRGRRVYVKFRGVDDRNAAAELNGRELSVPQPQALTEPDIYYQHDILGLNVETESGRLSAGSSRSSRPAPTTSTSFAATAASCSYRQSTTLSSTIDVPGNRIVVDLLPGLEFTSAASERPDRPRRR